MVDTHTFDGKLDKNLILSLSEVSKLSNEEKREKCNILCKYINNDKMKIIINDAGRESNYDKSNDIHAADLLYICVDFSTNKDFIELLRIQLTDMNTGFCPQGRTHRLFQLIMAFQ